MTLQPLIPLWAWAVVFAPLLGLAGWRLVAAWRAPARCATVGSRGAWARRTGLVALLALIGLGPSVPVTGHDQEVANVDLFFVVDRTGSMAAEDFDGGQERLVGVRHDITSLTADVPGARYSIISFDSQASRQLPLTSDAHAITSWADTLRREITAYSKGSLTDRPLDELAAVLQGAATNHPANTRLVFFLSDGEQTADGEPRSYEDLAPLVDGGAVLGYGATEGGRMKEYAPGEDPAAADYLKDPSRATVEDPEPDALSMIDEDNLRAIATQLGVPYAHRTTTGPTAELVAGVDPQQVAADGRRLVTAHRPVVWPLALVAAVLLGFEAWAAGRSAARRVGAPA
jgi:Ca-activated chloride channel homolog